MDLFFIDIHRQYTDKYENNREPIAQNNVTGSETSTRGSTIHWYSKVSDQDRRARFVTEAESGHGDDHVHAVQY